MKRHKCEQGFTLIEIIVASFILVLGVAMISTVLSTVVKKNFLSLRHTQAEQARFDQAREPLRERANVASWLKDSQKRR